MPKMNAWTRKASSTRKVFSKPTAWSRSQARKNYPAIKGAISNKSAELKYIDSGATQSDVDTTGVITLLNPIAQGDDNTNRDGRQVRTISCWLRLQHSLAGVNNVNSQTGRFIIFWDNASNGVLPTVAQVLVAANPNSFVNLNFQNRFTILYDHTSFYPGVNAAIAGVQSGVDGNMINKYIKINATTTFIGTGGGITTMGNGGLYLLQVGSQPAGNTAAISMWQTRVRFAEG